MSQRKNKRKPFPVEEFRWKGKPLRKLTSAELEALSLDADYGKTPMGRYARRLLKRRRRKKPVPLRQMRWAGLPLKKLDIVKLAWIAMDPHYRYTRMGRYALRLLYKRGSFHWWIAVHADVPRRPTATKRMSAWEWEKARRTSLYSSAEEAAIAQAEALKRTGRIESAKAKARAEARLLG